MSRKQIELDKLGCFGYAAAFLVLLLTVLLVITTALTFRNRGVQVALAAAVAFLVVGIVLNVLGNKQNERQFWRYKESLREELRPGTRFEAIGSLAQDLEGEFIRWIDTDTIEARVWDPRGGEREKGPFPFYRIKRIKE